MPAVPQPLKEFDKLVHVRDQHGVLIDENHYAYHIIEGTPYFERPIGSGNLFYPNGDPAGRLEGREVLEGKAHIEFEKPVLGAAKAERDLAVERGKNAELMRELEALRQERISHEAQKIVDEAKAHSKFAAHENKE